MHEGTKPYSREVLFDDGKQRIFEGQNLLQIAFPLGGIGAGCICLNGQGGLQDFSIHNTPNLSALPDGHRTGHAAFATLYFPEMGIARLVEGPMPPERIYDQGLKGQGYRAGGHEGLPRFRNGAFQGEYPFGFVDLSDPELPLEVRITGFAPFIPLDDKHSSMPCAILEYTLRNSTSEEVRFEFGYHLSHLAYNRENNSYLKTRNRALPGLGVLMWNEEDPNSPAFGSCALGVLGHDPAIKGMWFRGGWFDSISTLWREVSTGAFRVNDRMGARPNNGRNGGSILLKGALGPRQSFTYPVVICWHFPNVNDAFGERKEAGASDVHTLAEHGAGGASAAGGALPTPRWKPYYTRHWASAEEVLRYVAEGYPELRRRTQAFHDALFRSTLPSYVLDAVSANLGILKSPTVLRQANGNLWAWEGCFSTTGCCHGSCTHVWNYAQALPHLFPALERTLREQELFWSMDDNGHINFRSALPDGLTNHTFHAACDGQLGGIMKVYREWQISGREDWLEVFYPRAKRSMDYCIATWDPDQQGVLVEPHHNTYDIEFWGPDGMCSSFYLGALAAISALARDAGCPEDAHLYEEIARRGSQYLDENLFNGEYFEQKVAFNRLHASPSAEALEQRKAENPEEFALLEQEGPKYQYGSGCISDGVFGAWLAKQCFLESPQTRENVRKNLLAIFRYNFKHSLWAHANPQRPGYAMGDEPGLLLCTWPRGGKPTLPFVYSDEVWTGIEYQVAGHMISEGLVEEGLSVVRAARLRYDGHVRNPWNEYECGNYYARALSSYGLLFALSGFRYSLVEKTLWLAPQLAREPFEIFFSTSTGWGTLELAGKELLLRVEEGFLEIDRLRITINGEEFIVEPHITAKETVTTIITYQ